MKRNERSQKRNERQGEDEGRERSSAQRGSTEPYGCPLSEMQMTGGLLLRFLKQILTPAGADALSDSDTRLSSTTSFRCPLSKLDKWIIVGEKKNKKTSKNKMKGDSVELSRGERKYMTGWQGEKTWGEGGRLIKGILEMSESESHNQLT